MSDSLKTYLHDHLAGAKFAVDLLDAMAKQHTGQPIGAFAIGLKTEVEEDRQILQSISEQLGPVGPSLKEAASWMAEKLSRFKLSHESNGDFGTFEALEALALGITGKLALWRALASVAPAYSPLRTLEFDRLIARAESQLSRVEERRLQTAAAALSR